MFKYRKHHDGIEGPFREGQRLLEMRRKEPVFFCVDLLRQKRVEPDPIAYPFLVILKEFALEATDIQYPVSLTDPL